MRILHLIPTLSGGGAERQLAYLTKGQAEQGHQVRVAFIRPGTSRLEQGAVEFHQLSCRNHYDPWLFWQLSRLVKTFRPHLLQSWLYQMDILGALISRWNGVPWILRESCSELSHPPGLKTRLLLWLVSRARAIVSNSQAGDAYWQTHAPRVPRFIVQNGLPSAEIQRATPAAGLPWDNGSPLILYVGRLFRDQTGGKRVNSILNALAELSKTHRVQAAICGDGSELPNLRELSRKLRIEDSVHFLGQQPQSQVWSLLKRADLFITLSAHEGCPNSLLEAMAAGCPAVVSDIPAHRAILNEQSALFVDPDNPAETARLMSQLLMQPDRGAELAQAAVKKAESLSVQSMVKNWQTVYDSLGLSQGF